MKKPNKDTLVVGDPVDGIKHGDVIQLVHGMTSRALNTHDVAAPMSPHNQVCNYYMERMLESSDAGSSFYKFIKVL